MPKNTENLTPAGQPSGLSVIAGSASVVCHCGEPAILGIHFTNYDHRSWVPVCERCYQQHLENAQDTNDHEMRHFGGAWGLVTWEERDVTGAVQDSTDGSLSWPNAPAQQRRATDSK